MKLKNAAENTSLGDKHIHPPPKASGKAYFYFSNMVTVRFHAAQRGRSLTHALTVAVT